MEIVMSLFHKLIIIITLFIPCVLVAVVKVLVWIARRLYACVRRVFDFFNASTAAMQRTEPTITIRTRGNGIVPITSGNVENHRVKTTNQNKKNKKTYKEKQEIVAIPVPFNAAPSLNSTRTPWRLYSDFPNRIGNNSSQALSNRYEQLNQISNMKVPSTSRPTQHPVRLWSIDINVETTTPASDIQQPDCCESNENNAPESAAKDLEDITVQQANSETGVKSNTFSYSILTHVADAMVSFVLGTVQPIGSFVHEQMASIGRNGGIKQCSCILKAVANEMVGVVLGVVNPVCSYVKAQLANIERNRRVNQCSFILVSVANAMVGVVLGAVQPLYENSNQHYEQNGNVTKGVSFSILWRAIRAFYGPFTSAITTVKSKLTALIFRIHSAVSRLRASKQENTSHEMTRASYSNRIRKDQKGDKAMGVHDAHQAVSSTDTVANQSCITHPSPVSILQTSQQCRYTQVPYVWQNPAKINHKLIAPQNTGINLHPQTKTSPRHNTDQKSSCPLKEKVQLNASPTVGHTHSPGPGERQVKVSIKGKGKDKVASSSILPSNVDKPAKAAVGRKKKQNVVTAVHVDLPATTPSVSFKRNEKAMPRLIPPSYVNAIARAKAHVQEIRSPRVGLSNLVMPAKVSEESRMSGARNNDNKSSDEIQEMIQRAVSREKLRNIETEPTSNDVQASESFITQCGFNMVVPRALTEVMQNPFELRNINSTTVAIPRENIKRKAQGNTGASIKYETTVLNSARPTTQAAQKSDERIVQQPELMEVGESVDMPLRITRPEAMEATQQSSVVTEPFCKLQAQATTIFNPKVERLKPNASSNAKLETEEMETVQEQASVWNCFFSFSLPSFLAAPFSLRRSEEEMEVDEQTVPVTPSTAEQEAMDICQQPFAMAPPFGQHDSAKCPVLAAVTRRPEAFSALPQQETMEICQQLVHTSRPVARPLGELMDTKRPLASTVGMFREAAFPMKITSTEQHIQPMIQQAIQPAMQSVMQRPVIQQAMQPGMQSVMQPVIQRPLIQQTMQPAMQSVIQRTVIQRPVIQQAMQPAMQPVIQQPVMQQAMQPAMQSVKQQPVVQPAMQQAMHSVMQPVVVQPAMQQAMHSVMQPVVVQPVMQQLMQPAIQSVVKQPEMARRVAQAGTLFQSQHPQINYTIESRLSNAMTGHTLTSEVRGREATPKSRDQLTMEQLQLVPPTDPACYLPDDSDSDSEDDSDDEYELDLETIEKFSDLESSPDHAQFIAKLLAEKELTQWHDISGSDSDSDGGDKHELSELLDSEIIAKYSELEDVLDRSPEHVERLAKLLAEKESSSRRCNM